ncbi:Dipeptidyl peptidase IV (DPP IV) N-terminal region [Rhodanobacter sp. OK091]|nr:Dipeptidyl peptidase IV (DPP IV) N-terminal region [Rhodanobacter sp. OK091]
MARTACRGAAAIGRGPHVQDHSVVRVISGQRKRQGHSCRRARIRFLRSVGGSFAFDFVQRGFQRVRVVAVDATSGRAHAAVEETAKTFVHADRSFVHEVDGLGKEVVWISERNGWCHLYLFDGGSGRAKRQITHGDWVVRDVLRVDDGSRASSPRVATAVPTSGAWWCGRAITIRRRSVVENIYAGPHDSFVPKTFWPFGCHTGGDKQIGMQALADLDFIVVMIDGTGIANRSKAFHDVAWKNLGDSGFRSHRLAPGVGGGSD